MKPLGATEAVAAIEAGKLTSESWCVIASIASPSANPS